MTASPMQLTWDSSGALSVTLTSGLGKDLKQEKDQKETRANSLLMKVSGFQSSSTSFTGSLYL